VTNDDDERPISPDPDAHETTWITPAPTVPVEPAPTLVEPHLPPPPPVVPSWTSPTVGGTAPPPAYPAPPSPVPSYPPPSYPPPAHPPVAGATPGQRYAPPPYGQQPYVPGAQLPGVAGWGAVPQAPKPGVIPLRPLSVGEILDGAVTYIRRDPKTVLGISVAVAVALALLNFLALQTLSSSLGNLSSDTTDAEAIAQLLQLAGAGVAQVVVSFVLNVLAVGLLTAVMGQAVLGRQVTTSQAWARASKRFWPLLGLTLLVGLAVGALVVLGVTVSILVGWGIGSATDPGLGVFVGVVLGLAALVAGLWLYVELLLAPVALILENVGILTSMRRSFALVRRAWWRTFGIWLLASVLANVVSQVLSIPFTVLGGFSTLGSFDETATSFPLSYTIATSLGVLVANLVVLPFTSGVVALLYVDRRIRREALDIELARAAGLGT
jgi:hypothetical protein